ncbi:hypothetical protein Mgra_00010128 [Meloidogyne graminicola]|uniref:Uncharacterized protein n=1 Tax=Meloidogyne graminicola TaxID=189291 RepID=A0A8S9ZBB3_9BILA|nr:hypothetical protein Mgra_00010128 [Meloidogyne graminicola]
MSTKQHRLHPLLLHYNEKICLSTVSNIVTTSSCDLNQRRTFSESLKSPSYRIGLLRNVLTPHSRATLRSSSLLTPILIFVDPKTEIRMRLLHEF